MPDVRAILVLGTLDKYPPGPHIFKCQPLRPGTHLVMDRLVLSSDTSLYFRTDSVYFNDILVPFTHSPLHVPVPYLDSPPSISFPTKHIVTCGDTVTVNATNMWPSPQNFHACILGNLVDLRGDNVSASISFGHAYDGASGGKVCDSTLSPEDLAIRDLGTHGLNHLQCPSCLVNLIDREEATIRLLRAQLETCFGKAKAILGNA